MTKIKNAFTAVALLCAITFAFTPASVHGSEDGEFKGDYIVGDDDRKITVTPVDGSPEYKVKFEGEAKARIYFADGDEKQTEYGENDKTGKAKTKFIFKTGAESGVFINEKGKKEKVTRGN